MYEQKEKNPPKKYFKKGDEWVGGGKVGISWMLWLRSQLVTVSAGAQSMFPKRKNKFALMATAENSPPLYCTAGISHDSLPLEDTIVYIYTLHIGRTQFTLSKFKIGAKKILDIVYL